MKYLIKPLESRCIEFLLDRLYSDKSMAFTISQFCVDNSDCEVDNRLMEECLDILRYNWITLTAEPAFLDISHKCLARFLEDDNQIIAEEIDLFRGVCF